MRMVRSGRGGVLVVAVLSLAMGWIAVGEGPSAPVRDASPLSGIELNHPGAVTTADLADAAPVPVLAGYRAVESRLGPLWVMPGLAAALAAICVLRRLRASPTSPARRVLLSDCLSRRGPPLESFA